MKKNRKRLTFRSITAVALTLAAFGSFNTIMPNVVFTAEIPAFTTSATTTVSPSQSTSDRMEVKSSVSTLSPAFTGNTQVQRGTAFAESSTGAPQNTQPIAQPIKQRPEASEAAVVLPVQSEDWNLVLVNGEYPMPPDYMPELKTVDNRGFKFDARAIDALRQMLSDAEKAGLSPIICSSYRTNEQQTRLFNNKVARLEAVGLSWKQAVARAKTEIAYPGTSEHQLGLAADIVALDYQLLDEEQANTPEQIWLMAHCHEYGFILRYPDGKEDITGVVYEPWHYRYVGLDAAKYITEQGITLEEYLGK